MVKIYYLCYSEFDLSIHTPSLLIICRQKRSLTLQQVAPEAGVTVVFHVLLASNFKMTDERLFIRAGGDDLGHFRENCVDMIPVE